MLWYHCFILLAVYLPADAALSDSANYYEREKEREEIRHDMHV
jgi:hypothetical protein